MTRQFQPDASGRRACDLRGLIAISCWFALLTSVGEALLYSATEPIHGLDLLLPATLVNLFIFTAIALIFGALFALSARIRRRAASETVFVGVVGLTAGFSLVRALFLLPQAFMPRQTHLLTFAVAVTCSIGSTLLFRLFRTSVLLRQKRSLAGLFALVILIAIGSDRWERHYERQTLSQSPVATPGTPNVLLVVVDTLRADHLSAYGYPRHTSPFIDKLASEGVLFDTAIAPASWTLPSHVSMLTGYYPHEHGVDEADKVINDRLPTLGEMFQTGGYRTAGFSANTRFFSRRNGFARGFHHFEDRFQTLTRSMVEASWGDRIQRALSPFRNAIRDRLHFDIESHLWRIRATDVNARVLQWIDTTPDMPFFITMNYFDVHGPYALPSKTYGARYSDSPPALDSAESNYIEALGRNPLQDINSYDSNVSYVDDSLRELLSELSKRNQLKNTIVVITGDHGESFGEHGLIAHMNGLYFETIHVPLIFWGPRYIPAFGPVHTPVSLCSLPATLLDLVHNESGFGANPSLVSLWRDAGHHRPWPIPMAEISRIDLKGEIQEVSPAAQGSIRTIIDPEWQYIEYEHRGPELFRWQRDKKELHNEIRAEGPTAATMKTALLQSVSQMSDERLRQSASSNHEAQRSPKKQRPPRDDLGGLGYVQ